MRLAWLLILLSASALQAQYCNSPYCTMCNRLRAQAVQRQQLMADMSLNIESTPQAVVNGMLSVLSPQRHEVLYDLGCGDGRFVITAAKKYGCRAIGIEIDPEVAAVAKRKVKEAGLEDRVTIIVGDARTFDLQDADIVVMYLFPDLMAELPQVTNASRVGSYQHRIPGVSTKRWFVKKGDEQHYFYIWNAHGRG